MDKATRDDIQRFLVVQNPNVSLPVKYSQLMAKFDTHTADDFDAIVDDLVDEIELEEIRLKKQEVMFGVIEQDQAYYQSLIESTNEQINSALVKIQNLEKQLQHER